LASIVARTVSTSIYPVHRHSAAFSMAIIRSLSSDP
jgi:hypothetical protein